MQVDTSNTDKLLPVNVQAASPRRLLVTWANGQDSWVRSLVAETLASRKPVSESGVVRIYGLFLAEKRLSDEDSINAPLLELDEAEDVPEEALELVRMDNIRGVNAIASSQPLEFDPALTILFGQNGSGKTGYARIIKRLAAVRTAEPILPNAHMSAAQPEPSARISYKLGDDTVELLWRNEVGLPPFTKISVFDSPAMSLHVDSELGYVFTPAGLALFAYVSEGIKAVQSRIAQEASSIRPGSNTLLRNYPNGTAAYALIERLGPATDLAEVERLAKPDVGTQDRCDKLKDEISVLSGGALEARLAAEQQRVVSLERLSSLATEIATFDCDAYLVARDELLKAEEERQSARGDLFSSADLPGPVDDNWQAFIAAGEEYRGQLALDNYPSDGDQCLYCRQVLQSEALDLLRRYVGFLDKALLRRVNETGRRVDGLALRLNPTDVLAVREFLGTAGGQDTPPPWHSAATGLIEAAISTAEATKARGKCDSADLAARASDLIAVIHPLVTAARTVFEDLQTQKADRATALATKQKEFNEISARLRLKAELPMVKGYVNNAKRAAQLETLAKQLSQRVLRSLTDQSKLASEELVNRNFETLFAEECEALRAPNVALEFVGRGGKAERKKVVASYRPSAILSEGEQKVIAIADFLAEGRMRGAKAPIIFDDPVTSLDYRRLDEVARRIAELAESRQVVVLTHNIMFASSLIALRSSKKLRCKFYEICDKGSTKGELSPEVEPRLDTPKVLGGRINVAIEKARSATDSVMREAFIERGYGLLRSWCEAFVEQELLGNVTQRYRANIMMGSLVKINVGRLPAASAVANSIFERACRFMTGHSQAAEQLNARPTVADLESDWKKATDAREAYLA